MRAQWQRLVWMWRKIPGRTRLGMVVAVVAIAGLAWQHNAAQDTTVSPDQGAVAAGEDHSADGDGHAHGEYQLQPSAPAVQPDFSPEAARVTAQRFASNFASPNGNRDDWLARIGPDVMPELLDQYRLSDIRNIPQAVVTHVGETATSDPAFPTFAVAYGDGSSVEATLEMATEGWKVSSVVPVEAAPTPAEPPAPAPDPAAPATMIPAAAEVPYGEVG